MTEVTAVTNLYELIEQLAAERTSLDWDGIDRYDAVELANLHKNCALYQVLIQCANMDRCTPEVQSEIERMEAALMVLFPFVSNNMRAAKFSLAGKRVGAYLAELRESYKVLIFGGLVLIETYHPHMVEFYATA